MRVGVVAFGIAFLAVGTARASSFVTVEEPGPAASPSIIDVAPPTLATRAAEPVTISSEGSVELAVLDPLNMLPVDGNSVVRMQALSPSVVAVLAPDTGISNEIVAAIDGRKPRQNPLPMVMRGGITGDAFTHEIELGKALEKLPTKAVEKEPSRMAPSPATEALDQPQFSENGAPMPANGMASGGRPRHSALKPSPRDKKSPF